MHLLCIKSRFPVVTSPEIPHRFRGLSARRAGPSPVSCTASAGRAPAQVTRRCAWNTFAPIADAGMMPLVWSRPRWTGVPPPRSQPLMLPVRRVPRAPYRGWGPDHRGRQASGPADPAAMARPRAARCDPAMSVARVESRRRASGGSGRRRAIPAHRAIRVRGTGRSGVFRDRADGGAQTRAGGPKAAPGGKKVSQFSRLAGSGTPACLWGPARPRTGPSALPSGT